MIILSNLDRSIVVEFKKGTHNREKVAMFTNSEFDKYINIETCIFLSNTLLREGFKIEYWDL